METLEEAEFADPEIHIDEEDPVVPAHEDVKSTEDEMKEKIEKKEDDVKNNESKVETELEVKEIKEKVGNEKRQVNSKEEKKEDGEPTSSADATPRVVWERYLSKLGPQALSVVERLNLDHRLFESKFDMTGNTLRSLPETLPKGYVENLWEQVESLRSRVVAIISRQVRDHHEVFMQGICNIHEIKLDVAQTRVLTHNTRAALREADDVLVKGILEVLVRRRRRTRMKVVLEHLERVRRVLVLESDLDTALRNDNFPAAISAYRACRTATQKLPKFRCLAGLRERMRTGKSLIKKRLQLKLQTLCRRFDADGLLSVIHTYRMMEEDMLLAPDLKEAYLNTVVQIVHDALVVAVRGRPRMLAGGELSNSSDLVRMRVRDLCDLLSTERFADCLVKVLSGLSQLLLSYHLTQDAFSKLLVDIETERKLLGGGPETPKDTKILSQDSEESSKEASFEDDIPMEGFKDAFFRLRSLRSGSVDPVPPIGVATTYVSTLVIHKRTLWQYVQEKAANVISAVQMDTVSLPVEDFLRVLAATDRFLMLGEQLTRSKEGHSIELRNAIKIKSQEYFRKFHAQSFERLRLLTESEMWRRLPMLNLLTSQVAELRKSESPLMTLPPKDLYTQFLQGKELFISPARTSKDSKEEKTSSEEDEKRTAGTKKEDEKEEKKENKDTEGPVVVVAAAVKVAQFMGRYIRLMEAFPKAAEALLNGLQQLFDFYIYTVLVLFDTHPHAFFNDLSSPSNSDYKSPSNPTQNGRGISRADSTLPDLDWHAIVGSGPHVQKTFPILCQTASRVRSEILNGTFGSAAIFADSASQGAKNDDRPRNTSIERKSPTISPPPPPVRQGNSPSIAKSTSDVSQSTGSASLNIRRTKPSGGSPRAQLDRKRSIFGLVSGVSSLSVAASTPTSSVQWRPKLPSLAKLHPKVNLSSQRNLRGLNERLNAAEASVFLVRVLRTMRERMVQAVAPAGASTQSKVEGLVRYAEKASRELRLRTNRAIAHLVVQRDRVAQSVSSCKWDKNELSSRNHSYVDRIVSELRDATAVIEVHGNLPEHVERYTYRALVAYVIRSLVSAYASIRKCTTEGRASMSLDLNVLRSQVAKLKPRHLRPLPLWDYATSFVSAFYLPEDDLCKWVAEHPGYPSWHYLNVASVGAGASRSKRQRERLLQRIEAVLKGGEFSRNKRALDHRQEEEEKKTFHDL